VTPLRLQRGLARRIGAHGSWVRRMRMSHELEEHNGCVNTLQWNTAGDKLGAWVLIAVYHMHGIFEPAVPCYCRPSPGDGGSDVLNAVSRYC